MTNKVSAVLFAVAFFLSAGAAVPTLEEVVSLQESGDLPAALDLALPAMESAAPAELPFAALVYSQLLIDLEDLSAPLDTIESAESLPSELSDYLKFNLARLYLKRGAAEKALLKIDSIKDGTPGAYFKYRRLREKARICGQAKLYGKEALVWGEIGQIENLSRQKKKEASFKEAAAWERSGAYARAGRLYRELAFDFSPNPFGSRALKAYLRLGANDYPPKDDIRKEELIRKLLDAGRAEDALSLYQTFPKEKANPVILAQILYKARRNGDIFCMADEVVKKNAGAVNGDRGTVLKALWATLRTNDVERALKYHNWLKANLPPDHKLFIENNYAMGCSLYVNGRFAESLPYLAPVKSDKAGQFYRNALYKDALSRLVIGEAEEGLFDPLLAEKGEFRERAVYALKKWYSRDAGGDPIPGRSYYSAVSDKEFSKKTSAAISVFGQRLFTGRIDRNSTACRLYRAGFPLFALDQLEKRGRELTKEDAITRMMLLSEIGELCFEFPSDFDYRVGLSHPTPWKREILLAANEQGVDPSLMFAIARRESRFDPMAYSNVGAVGLFQLMPETARKIAGKEVSEEDLLDPLVNARIAAKYIKALTSEFPSSAQVAASYNAGEDVVSVWRKSFGDEDVLFTLLIPYFETQNYAEGVLFDKAVYKERLSR